MEQNKTLIKFKEKVTFIGTKKAKTVMARIDTGAKRCSIDQSIADEIGVGNIIKHKEVKSALGTNERPIIKIMIQIKDRKISAYCTIADRSRLKYPALIGRNVLRRGFIVEENLK